MATMQVTDLPKPSFAKVAAGSASKENGPVSGARRVASPTKDKSAKIPLYQAVVVPPVIANGGIARPLRQPPAQSPTVPQNPQAATQQNESLDKLAAGVKGIGLGNTTPSLVVNGSSDKSKASNRDSGSDGSQKADSTSDLGTKPPSLDGKSITSGTTFALDEKESLRPDDSASVMAAAEDDDAFSIRGSLIASRMGSEVAARVRSLQLGDMPERRLTHHGPGLHSQGIATPQSTTSDQQAIPTTSMPLESVSYSSDTLGIIYQQAPDEKLLEAMQSSKDRIFLLRLEKDVIEFVQESKEPYMDLPPSNSFCRMLTHKLADYYHMTHSYEKDFGAVRIFRTPFCRVPPALASIVANVTDSSSSTPPPAMLPRKIMRRGEDGEMALSSASPSKPTSEVGSDQKDKGQTKEKPSREEREEAYNKARQRIFGSSEKTEESSPENDGENGVSRASSVSAKERSNLGKRGKVGRQRKDSGSFESRNHYVQQWGPHQATWTPQPQYMPSNSPPFGGPVQPPPYQAQMLPNYPPPNPAFPNMVPNPSFQPYNNMTQYPAQVQQQRFQPPPNAGMGAFAPPPPPPSAPLQNWQPGYNPVPYPPRAPPPGPPPGPPAGPPSVGIPYAYGQLPVNVNPHDPKSQHPIPGSYNRHAFNPTTQSFIPSNGMPPMQAPPPTTFIPPGPLHGSPPVGSPHMGYASYQPPMPPSMPPPQPYGGSGYPMGRQESNNPMPVNSMPVNSMPVYHPAQTHQRPQHQPIPPLPPHAGHLPHPPPPPTHIPAKPVIHHGPGQAYGSLPHFGNPATLPPKPT